LNHNDMAMDQVAPKSEPLNEGSISSAVSTPDPEGEVLTQDVAQTQKRKGGRKPVRKNHRHSSGGGCPFLYVFFSGVYRFYLFAFLLLIYCCSHLLALSFDIILLPCTLVGVSGAPHPGVFPFIIFIDHPYLLPMSALFSFVLT
jgi:hypothetical protein